MSYFIFPNDDTTKPAIAFLNIDMDESMFCNKIAYRVKEVWVDNAYRGKGYAAFLPDPLPEFKIYHWFAIIGCHLMG